MQEILIKAGCYVAIIGLGMWLRRIGFFKKEDFSVLSKIVIRITLPCAIITSFAGKTIDPALLSLTFIAIGCGITYIAIAFFINRTQSRDQQSFEMLNLAGYNIGTFVIPFALSSSVGLRLLRTS